MDEEDLYDEFGTYIGPDIDGESSGQEDSVSEEWREEVQEPETVMRMDEDVSSTSIVLHEDKKYYPDAEEVYPGVEVLIQEEDTQALSEPIIKPIKEKRFAHSLKVKHFPPTTFTKEYMLDLMNHNSLIRCVTIAGHLHHGKTSFVQMLVDQTHEDLVNVHQQSRFTDVRYDEEERGLSIKASPMSLILPDSREKSYLVHLMDTPGHINFSDEVTASLRLCDGVVLIVDVIEGLMLNTERIIRHTLQEGLALTVVLNKIDRLILDLKIPPDDAYYKIKHTLDSINQVIADFFQNTEQSDHYLVSPVKGNVMFASSEQNWSFTLIQFAQIYLGNRNRKMSIKPEEFAKRLWGDLYFDQTTRKFSKTPNPEVKTSHRSFVEFILDPLYKLYSQVLGESSETLTATLRSLNIKITKDELRFNVKPLLKVVLHRFFGEASGFVDMLAKFVPSPQEAAESKVASLYTGPNDSQLAVSMKKCDPKGPLVVHVTKLYPDLSLNYFNAFGRVFSGTLEIGASVKVMGEHYSLEDEEDMTIQEVEALYICQTRYNIEVNSVAAGNWVLIKGVDSSIAKTATLVSSSCNDAYIFKPLKFNTASVMKIAVEPLNPAELPKMLDGIRKINKTYPLCTTKVEESGEHVILGTGELYLDSVMYDLRKVYTEIEIKVSDPVVTFCETVVETSSLKCFAETPNKQNKFTFIAQPLEPGLAEDIENNVVNINWSQQDVRTFFQNNYEWDILSARNIWAFGPDTNGPNVLVNGCLPSEVNMTLLNTVKDSIVQGFDWASREGPLCEEPIRNCKFEIVHSIVAEEPILRAGNQVIPTARRVAYSAFLTARPRLMEPIYLVDILSPPDTITAIYNVLQRRRGHVVEEKKKEGSPLYSVRAYIPVIDSFGFETDLRSHSQGQAFCLSVFHHWDIVPGDPLDRSIILRPLEDAPTPHLARDFMVKTRRRKGLSEDVSRNKFFDDDLLARIENMGVDLNTII